MARVSNFEPTLDEFLSQYGSKRTQMMGKPKSKLPKDLPKVKSTTPYIQPKAFNPTASTVDYGIQTSPQLPKIQGVTAIKPNSFGTGVMDSLKGYGSAIADSKIGKFVSNEAGILGEALNSPTAKIAGTGLNIVSAASTADQAYRNSLSPQGATQAVAEREHPEGSRSDIFSLMGGQPYDRTKAHLPTYNEDPNSTGFVQSHTTPLITTQSTPAVASKELTPIDIKPNAINQFLYPGIQQSPMTQNMSPTIDEQSKTNILGEQIPMSQLPKGVGYVNGKLFDSNKQSTQGMFNGYSKERDAALDSYGKVDKNSEFYKRNKKAMENLQ